MSEPKTIQAELADKGEMMESTQTVRVEVVGWYDDVLEVVKVGSKAELAKVLNGWLDHEGVASVTITKTDSAPLP